MNLILSNFDNSVDDSVTTQSLDLIEFNISINLALRGLNLLL